MTIDEFKQAVQSDEELMAQWKDCISKVDPKDREAQITAAMDFAKAHGLELSYEDVITEIAGSQELDADELDAVTGGWGPGNCGELSEENIVVCPVANEFCWFDYWCIGIVSHSK